MRELSAMEEERDITRRICDRLVKFDNYWKHVYLKDMLKKMKITLKSNSECPTQTMKIKDHLMRRLD